LVKFNAFKEAKNEILAPSEPQVIVPPKQKQIPPKKSVKVAVFNFFDQLSITKKNDQQ
jgi:hypothetical protein